LTFFFISLLFLRVFIGENSTEGRKEGRRPLPPSRDREEGVGKGRRFGETAWRNG